MAYSFRKIFFKIIGQNLKQVLMTYFFLELWIFFLQLYYRHLLLWVYVSPYQVNIYVIQTPKETNYEIKTNIFTCF